MKKKIIAHFSIILILSGVFCNVCTNYNRISVYDCSVYAEADNWSACDSSDLVTAFRYYCKSRNLAIEGSVADALTSFTTTTFNNLCFTLGIDPTQLQAEIKKTTEGNLGLRFLFTNTGVTAYNRIFAEFLQNNNLNVGDEVDNEVVKTGDYFTDKDGNGCYVFVSSFITSVGSSKQTYGASDYPYQQKGTYFKFDENFAKGLSSNYTSSIINLSDNVSLSLIFKYNSSSNNNFVNLYTSLSPNSNYLTVYNYYKPESKIYTVGYPCIIQGGNGKLYLGAYSWWLTDNTRTLQSLAEITNGSVEDGEISLTTNNTTINNNTYNNNYVIIYHDGDTYISDDDDEPLPTTPPDGGGGGGGGDNPTNPDIPPVDPTPTPSPSIPDWDIELPEMPTGNDWLLYGLEKKFPWDIPYNLMYMLSLFAADPETPHFEGTIDLKIVQWNYDIDLAPFDDIAGYVRDIEFIGFLLGLMLLTRKLIWG